ncbi:MULTISPECIES: hypothetical protein [Niastella]|uniref:DUF4136 domain-containing protein n=1 Tax=Niastella soli TaxID=2821487 RepID=A0ABS3Z3B5_9BACT|nr:hypothetical protein [Niastella soli]MBO9204663.1 hypothetical protein [Niastella soli]
MKRKNFVILVAVLMLASCKGQVNNNKIRQPVLMDIRTDTTNFWSNFHNVRQLSKQLNLNPVEVGFDSLQIRVWFDHSMALRKHLVIIEKQNHDWSGRLYEMNVGYVDTLNYNIIQHYEKKNVKPASGWPPFINDLSQLKIRELSDSSRGGADGITYCVEILTPGKYTYYDFYEPENNKDKDWQAANMVKIIALLEREFKFTGLKGR